MRKIFNKIFRYRLVSIYFILSQLVILTAIFGVLNTINKAYAKENDIVVFRSRVNASKIFV